MAVAVIEQLKELVLIAGYGIETFGVFVIIVGCAIATVTYVRKGYSGSYSGAYEDYRHNSGRSIILGLEFLIAGDAVRTVVVQHTLENIAVLGLIVLLRAFLSLSLSLEIEGRLPWQKV